MRQEVEVARRDASRGIRVLRAHLTLLKGVSINECDGNLLRKNRSTYRRDVRFDDGTFVVLGASVLRRSIHPGNHARAIRVSELREARFSREEVEAGDVQPIDAILDLLHLVVQGSPAVRHIPGMLLAN